MNNDRRTGVQELLLAMAPYLLDSGVDFPIFCELAKLSYALTASRSAGLRNGRPNHALISAETGINRRELRQMLKRNQGEKTHTTKKTLAERIQKLWNENPRFLSKKNSPRRLRIDNERDGFVALARMAASDLPSSAILNYAVKMKIARCSRGYAHLVPIKGATNNKSPQDPVRELFNKTGMLQTLTRLPQNLLRINQLTTVLRTGNQSEARFLLREAVESARRTIDGLALARNLPAHRKQNTNRYAVNVAVVTTLNKIAK